MLNRILITLACCLALYFYPHRSDLQQKAVYDFNNFASSSEVEQIELTVAGHSFALNADGEQFQRYIQLIAQSDAISHHQAGAEYFKLNLKGKGAVYTARLTFADYKMNNSLKNLVTLIVYSASLQQSTR